MLDCDLLFNVDTIQQMIITIEKDDRIGMVTPFTENILVKGHYFDTLALIINNQRYWPDCPFTTCSKCTLNKLKPNRLINVDSAFNGMCFMYTKYYNECNYYVNDGDKCEHDSFNAQYKQISNKNIVIDPTIRLIMN